MLYLVECIARDGLRTLEVLASNQGRRVGLSAIGRVLGATHHVVRRRLQLFSQAGIIRLLFPLPDCFLPENYRMRHPKAPKLYFRDTALLVSVLGIGDGAELQDLVLGHRIFAGYMLERVVASELRIYPDTHFYCYGGYRNSHVDLLLCRAGNSTGLIFRLKNSLRPRDWGSLKALV